MALLAVVGLSARLMAEAAARDGFEAVALDVFGDIDTRTAAARWVDIGTPGALQIDRGKLLAALGALAREGQAIGWVAGSGFEGQPELLAQAAATLPLIGMPADAVAQLRDPARFFGTLAECDIEHPPVHFGPLADATGWLQKDFGACGGAHIRPAPAAAFAPPGHYFQRQSPGQAMSASFIADGRRARLLGINQQIVRRVGEHPYVYCGVLGPVPVAEEVRRRVQDALARLVPAFGLRGAAGLDFLLAEGRHVAVLEINPRPPASLGLYGSQPWMAAHVRACTAGELPPPPPAASRIEGQQIVFARRPLAPTEEDLQWLAEQPQVHDVPSPGQRFAPGEPVCSVSTHGDSVTAVLARLHGLSEPILTSLEEAA